VLIRETNVTLSESYFSSLWSIYAELLVEIFLFMQLEAHRNFKDYYWDNTYRAIIFTVDFLQ